MAEFTLHCFSESGNAYKAALMLSLCEADWEVRRVAYFSGETQRPEFRATNEMGEVPVLDHHRPGGDLRLSQSGVILHYLAEVFRRFGPETEEEKLEILRWILFDNHKLTSYTATARFRLRFLKMPADDPVNAFLVTRMTGALTVLDTHLEGRRWVVAERPTIADLSLCGYLFWPSHFGVSWADFPAIGAWLDRIRALDGWAMPEDLMPSGQEPESKIA
ncbi:MAG: glutathione S-transferase family protein [Pararhizobium sp.]